jgi:two-component system response regulator FixJ
MAKIAEKHIYFLDDEPTICDIAKDILENLAYKVICFSNPNECLESLYSNKCDLLITDLKMPEKDGFELLMDVQRQAPWIPVLVMTGYGNIPTAVKAMKAGAVDFIEKPLDKKTFVQKIKSTLEKNVSTDSCLGAPLTKIETKILGLIINNKSNNEIAIMLHRNICTIEYHRARIMRKLGVDNVVDLVKRVVSMGLVDIKEKPYPEPKGLK